MSRAAHFLAYADRGRLIFDEPGRVSGLLAKHNRQRIDVTIGRHSPQRTLRQNAYFHGPFVGGVSEWSGHMEAEVKDALKWMFLRKTIVLPTGEEVETVPSTADLTVEQFSEFLDRCHAWAAEAGCPIPTIEECREGMEISA